MQKEDHTKEHLLLLEKSLFRSVEKKTAIDFEPLIANEFIEFGSSGRVYNRQEVIEGLLQPSNEQVTVENFNTLQLNEDVMLVTYIAVKTGGTSDGKKHSLRSSIWKFIDSRWQIVFHQGTTISSNY